MASIGTRLLSEILRTKNLSVALELGVKAEQFKDPEERAIFKYMVQFYRAPETQKGVPLFETIKRRFASFEESRIKSDAGRLSDIANELKLSSLESDVRGYAAYFKELADNDPVEALKAMIHTLPQAYFDHTAGLGRGFGVREILEGVEESYQNAQDGTIYGIPWPWDCLNEDTLGKHPGDFIVFYGRMKSMKCVCEGQRVMGPDGSFEKIEDLGVTQAPSYTASTGAVRMADAVQVVSGTKDSVEVTTESGLALRTGKNHLYMVPGGGYERIRDLGPGDYVATARRLPDWKPSRDGFPIKDAHLLGLLVGDEQKPGDKRVPKRLFRSSRKAILSFLAAYLDTGGQFAPKSIAWSSASKELIRDVQHLLMRFGIRGRIEEVTTNFDTKAYHLNVYSKEQAALLYELIHPLMLIPRKKDALKKITLSGDNPKRNVDGVPYTKKLYDMIISAKGDKPWPRTGDSKFDRSKLFRTGYGYRGSISRDLLTIFADAFSSQELRFEAETDIIWEKISNIEDIGRVPCYDICIQDDQDPNFVVEGFVVHNTWLILHNAVNDFEKHNRRVMFWSREMDEKKLKLRLGSLLAKVDYQLLKKGRLPQNLYEMTRDKLRELVHFMDLSESEKEQRRDHDERDIIVLCGRTAPKSVGDLETQVETWRPDILYVDSFYHLEPKNKKESQYWLRVQYLAEELKSLALNKNIPVIGAAQANRSGEKMYGENMSDMAGSDAIGREADLVLRIIKKRKDNTLNEPEYEGALEKARQERVVHLNNMRSRLKVSVPDKVVEPKTDEDQTPRYGAELGIILPGNREGTLDAFKIHAVPGYNFEVISTDFTSEAAKQWVEDDNKEAQKEAKKAKGRMEDKPKGGFARFTRQKEPE